MCEHDWWDYLVGPSQSIMKERCNCIVALQDCYGTEDQAEVSLHHSWLLCLALNPVSVRDFALSGLSKETLATRHLRFVTLSLPQSNVQLIRT